MSRRPANPFRRPRLALLSAAGGAVALLHADRRAPQEAARATGNRDIDPGTGRSPPGRWRPMPRWSIAWTALLAG
jgi:hypothetical protein